jgi:hypothetical protein
MARRSNKESLAQITSKLFALVKSDVKSAIEKGRLLQRHSNSIKANTPTGWKVLTGRKPARNDIVMTSPSHKPPNWGLETLSQCAALACGPCHARESA